jgi:siroheme synthase-like protein
MLPLVFDLSNKPVLVVGLGRIGAHKATQLIEAGAVVHVVTEEVLADVPADVASLTVRPFRPSDLDGVWLVVSATGNPHVDDDIVAHAEENRIFYNVVDDKERCSFYFAALHRDGDVVIATSSSGASPALAQWVRNRVRGALPNNLAEVAQQLRAEREQLHAQGFSSEIDWSGRLAELLSD